MLRGLNDRLIYAKNKALLAAGVIDRSDEEWWYLLEVEVPAQGRADFYAGIEETPSMYAGEPDLFNAHVDGWNAAAELEEMSHCPDCQTGDPCPVHG